MCQHRMHLTVHLFHSNKIYIITMCMHVCMHIMCAYFDGSKSSITAPPVVTLSVPDRKLLPERNEFGGDGLTVTEQS